MALLGMQLRDFVIVQRLEIEFESGFTALTGETGAGKSILIDALQLLLGARGDAGVVREGADKSELSATFDATDATQAWLSEVGFENEEDTIVLRRVLFAAGKSRAWINGSAATATQLRALGDLLVDIHGQHAWTQLSKPDSIRRVLDGWAGINLTNVQRTYSAWRAAEQALQSAQQNQADFDNQREQLQWKIQEVQALAPQADEWTGLEEEHSLQSSAQDVQQACAQAMQCLDADGSAMDGVGDVVSLLHTASAEIEAFADRSPDARAIAQQLQQCMAEAQDAHHRLRDLSESAVPDEERLAFLDARVAQWLSLARKYKCTPDELPQTWQTWQQQLEQLEKSVDIEQLTACCEDALSQWRKVAEVVTTQRTQAAYTLSQQVTETMQTLGMAGGSFAVQLNPLDAPSAHGAEEVFFLMAGHPGATPKPVHKIASGGELSRIALAIAVRTSQSKSTPTLVFDEVDAGVGGQTAVTVGELMRELGAAQQVMTITHLAQVAAHAHQQYVVRKVSQNGHTNSEVQLVHSTQRVEEIARMLGGSAADAASLAHAQNMLNHGA